MRSIILTLALLPSLALAHDGTHDCAAPVAILGEAATFPVEVPTLLYFGFTACDDECPTDVSRNHAAVTAATEAGHPAASVFVSVDPVEDQATVDAYAENWPGTTGRTWDPALARTLYSTATPSGDADQPWVHSRTTYVIAPGVGVVALAASAQGPERLAELLACAGEGEATSDMEPQQPR